MICVIIDGMITTLCMTITTVPVLFHTMIVNSVGMNDIVLFILIGTVAHSGYGYV